MNDRLIEYIKSSFLSNLIQQNSVTDISYNGVSVFYQDNKLGRRKADLKVSSEEVLDFIRQIANYSEKQFSYANPILDVSCDKYRINAVHPSIVRVKNGKSCSFAMRIASSESRIKNDHDFMGEDAKNFLLSTLEKGESLVIAGPTGSGKTELQKYLLSSLKDNSRVIVIDNIEELEYLRVNDSLDLTSWQISQSNEQATMQELIRNALRSNPDWLVVAEARGKEMNEVLNSVMTGHPIVTTLHAKTIESIPKRICRMVEMANINQKHEDILDDIYNHLNNYVFLNRSFDNKGHVLRYIECIATCDEKGKFNYVYRRKTA